MLNSFKKYIWCFKEANRTAALSFNFLKKIFKYTKKNIPNKTEYIWHFKEVDCMVVLSFNLLKKIFKYAKQDIPNETGGTLVGRYSSDGKTAFIQGVLLAKKVKEQRPTSFTRPSDQEDKSLGRVYKKSKGEIHYIGEWHTHPHNLPKPSYQDEDTLIDLAKQPSVKTNKPIMMIAGNRFSSVKDVSCMLGLDDGKVIIGRLCKK